jgi:hypothetical protein
MPRLMDATSGRCQSSAAPRPTRPLGVSGAAEAVRPVQSPEYILPVRTESERAWGQRLWRRSIIAVAILASLWSCKAAQEPVVVPRELIGVWKTDNPRYLDRYFELTIDTITLAMGKDGKESYPVQKLEKHSDTQGISYALTYRNPVEDVADTLSFDYEPTAGGAIRFKNQQNLVWKKAPGS